jgi:hypothetical protein
MNIKRFSDYNLQDEMTNEFLNSFDKMIVESEDGSSYKKVTRKVISDLKLNVSLIATFGAGIGALYPVVDGLMKNMNIDSFNLNVESVVLLTLAAVTITYLEEKRCKSIEEEEELTKDSKSMLEELKMRGFGNGIVKKLIKGLESIKNIFSIIGRHIGAVIGGVIDMFAYTSLLIPLLNGVMAVIDKYELNLDTLPQNFLGLAVGVGTIIAKHGIVEIITRLKSKFTINQKEVLDDIETPVIQKFATFGDSEKNQAGDLIKEQ